jgi:hypothetical protein
VLSYFNRVKKFRILLLILVGLIILFWANRIINLPFSGSIGIALCDPPRSYCKVGLLDLKTLQFEKGLEFGFEGYQLSRPFSRGDFTMILLSNHRFLVQRLIPFFIGNEAYRVAYFDGETFRWIHGEGYIGNSDPVLLSPDRHYFLTQTCEGPNMGYMLIWTLFESATGNELCHIRYSPYGSMSCQPTTPECTPRPLADGSVLSLSTRLLSGSYRPEMEICITPEQCTSVKPYSPFTVETDYIFEISDDLHELRITDPSSGKAVTYADGYEIWGIAP